MDLVGSGERLGKVIGHEFTLIEEIEPGVPAPVEALSGDHTVGLYGEIMPRKMRDQLQGFVPVQIGHFRPESGPSGLFLEVEELRGCHFQSQWLQFLEEGWQAFVDEVKYPAQEVLGSLYTLTREYGRAYIYLHQEIPMPLWIRPNPLGEALVGPQIAIQGRSLDQVIFTNIHTEVSMEYARRWAAGAQDYYKRLRGEEP